MPTFSCGKPSLNIHIKFHILLISTVTIARLQGVRGQMPCPPPWQSKVIIIKLNIKKDIVTALADATNDLSMPCHEQRSGGGTARLLQILLRFSADVAG